MKKKFYRVVKENFLWEEGAILRLTEPNGDGYTPIDDLFKKHEGDEYITAEIVEKSPEYFERVYKVDLATRVIYETKDKAKELFSKQFKQ